MSHDVLTANVEMSGRHLKILGKVSAVVPHVDFGKSFYNNMQDTNFKLVFNGTEVPCHKSVLAAASPVFEAMVGSHRHEICPKFYATGFSG